MTKNDKLLPCPFCGGEAEFNDTSSTWVRCAECGAETQCQIEKKDAAQLWNRRELEADVARERERCADAAAAAVMKFRSKVGGRYYPGYHEDMRDAVRKAVLDASLLATQESR